jgi:hypothetical protein
MSVILCAPAAVASLAALHPDRHAAVAAALGCDVVNGSHSNAAATLKSKLVQLMRSTGMPSGVFRRFAGHDLIMTFGFDQVLRLRATALLMLRRWRQQRWRNNGC